MATTIKAAASRRSPPVWRHDAPYNRLPLLPPAAELETRAVLKRCITARAAVAELKQAAERIPNQGVLINSIPLLESQASSEIENIVTTSDRLFAQRDRNDASDPATKEALRYSQSLLGGFRSLAARPLTLRTAEEVCTQIMGVETRVRRVPGTALARETAGGAAEVVYTPPVGEDLLRGLLSNWERFLHERTEIDPLVRMAVGHYQFEAIHPFTDGNGRTGRVLNSLFLVSEGLLTLPILYLSRYLLRTRADYYRLLLAVTTDDAWEAWTLYIVEGVEETALWTRDKIDAIAQLMEHTASHIRAKAPQVYRHELVSLVFELPYCRIGNVVEAGLAERRAASRHLKALVEVGVLQELTVGREKLFVHPKLLRLLTGDSNEFALYG
ncbi:MAG: protein adenylyltransferase Fic [Lacipirellulaceae bacterium]